MRGREEARRINNEQIFDEDKKKHRQQERKSVCQCDEDGDKDLDSCQILIVHEKRALPKQSRARDSTPWSVGIKKMRKKREKQYKNSKIMFCSKDLKKLFINATMIEF